MRCDIYNGHYNPTGILRSSEYSFPVSSGSVDIAYAASVFTHLLEADCEHYLVETARALRPGGRLIASLHDQQIGEAAFLGSESRIDIHPDYFAEKASAAGLPLESNLGYVGGQRIMVFKKTRNFTALRWSETREFVLRTWGHYIREEVMLRVL